MVGIARIIRDLGHDHVNAITGMRGFVELALDEKDQLKREDLLRRADHEAERAAALVHRLLMAVQLAQDEFERMEKEVMEMREKLAENDASGFAATE